MLPLSSRLAFLMFAVVAGAWGAWGFYRLYRRVRRGRADPEARFDRPVERVVEALVATLTQWRTFKKRPVVGVFHSFIFYGFVLYGLVNLVDAVDGFFPLTLRSTNPIAAGYLLLADVFSLLVLLGVLALVARRFLLPSRREFRFNARTMLHEKVRLGRITRDSLIVSGFILFHVGSRALGAGAKLLVDGPDTFQPFATLISHLIPAADAVGFRIVGYWGALGSVVAFLAYFPYSKHVHIFMAPAKYSVARRESSGVMPPLKLDLEAETSDGDVALGARHLEDLAWPRLLDAYACIQCNRCQDVCPASATGKSLSPAALEINKRMELNGLASGFGLSAFEAGAASARPLLQFALSPEAAWACTTCGACIEVCPVGDEQMLDILDIRRHQVMIEGDFPVQLQTAFRGMERAQNPWGINRGKRLDWADGLTVRTTDEHSAPDVLYWVGCAASYDPSAQKTARAFVQLLDHAGVDYAVLGKKECCTGDSARRAGNEVLYRQLADENVSTLNTLRPKLIVASCPHCMNSLGKEYRHIGGDYRVMHHTEYLESLVAEKRLVAAPADATVTYHDPCYLGRHNGVYDAPRNLLKILSNDVVEMGRARENSFCCGAGGAQFWKEEEAGDERISDHRFREAQATLSTGAGDKVLAVGCPFCKSMLASTPLKGEAEDVAIKDVAELLLEGVLKAKERLSVPAILREEAAEVALAGVPADQVLVPVSSLAEVKVDSGVEPGRKIVTPLSTDAAFAAIEPARKKWTPKEKLSVLHVGENADAAASGSLPEQAAGTSEPVVAAPRPKWQPRSAAGGPNAPVEVPLETLAPANVTEEDVGPTVRKKWSPKKATDG